MDQILHVLTSLNVSIAGLVLALDLLRGHRLSTLLHLVLHVVKDSVKVDWVELDGNFDCRVLLEVYEWLLTLLWVHHARGAFDALSLLHRDFFSVEYHQLDQPFNDNHTIVRLSRDRIVDQ